MPKSRASRKSLISDIADRVGLHAGTVRYYEKIGLIHPSRSEGGYRVYSDSDCQRLRFIMRAKELNLTLIEIGAILSLHDKGEAPCGEVLRLLDRKIATIDTQIQQLTSLRRQLVSLRRGTPKKVQTLSPICPILESGGPGRRTRSDSS